MNHPKKNKDAPVDFDRARSTIDVSCKDSCLNLSIGPPSPALSTFTLTPGKSKNISEDMEILRISRQDNPFIQQVIASRESIIDSLELESDHVNLMAKDLVLDIDVDPLSLPEVHEHMIRSPPPTIWPKSPNFSVFHFPNGVDETLLVEVDSKKEEKSDLKPKHARKDDLPNTSKKSHPKSHHHSDRFSLLTSNGSRSSAEDSVCLMKAD